MRTSFLLIVLISFSIHCDAGEPTPAESAAEFQLAWKEWNAWADHVEPGTEPPPELSDRLNKTFNGWIRADQSELLAKVRQCEALPERDGSLAIWVEQIVQTCESRTTNEAIAMFPGVAAWYASMQGHALALVHYDRASDAWTRALKLGADSRSPGDKNQSFAVMRFAASSMMQLYTRHGKYEEIVSMFSPAYVAPHALFLYQGDSGKELMAGYAAATVKFAKTQGEFERAVRQITVYLEIEQREAPRTAWSDEFSRGLTDIFNAAKSQAIPLRLTMQQYMWIAHGALLSAHEKLANSEKEALNDLNIACLSCRRALSLASRPETDIVTRLKYEPAAWMALGTAYVKSRDYHEAIIVFKDLLHRFSPAGRTDYLPALKDTGQATAQKVADLLKQLDKPKNEGGLLAQAQGDLFFALKQNNGLHSDVWNKGMLSRVFETPVEDPFAPDFTDVAPLPRPPRSPGGIERLKALAESGLEAYRWVSGVALNDAKRTFAGRGMLVRKYGGSERTEAAVASALRWLAYHQEPDGHWDAMKYRANQKTDTAITALALMAFLANGSNERSGEYRDNVRRAVAWLKSRQNEKGMIWDTTDAGGNRAAGYPCAIATHAMVEAAELGGVKDTIEAALRAVTYCTEIHQGRDAVGNPSGWRYASGSVGDMSVTGWFIMALKSARSAGMKVKPESLEGAARFLETVEHKIPDGDPAKPASSYWYMRDREFGHGGNHHRLSAIGVTSRFFLGWKPKDLNSSVEAFMKKGGLPSWGANGESVDLYYWYYGTLASFQAGGDSWNRWNEFLKPALLNHQRTDGDEAGSWNPVGEFAPDWGRAGQTALAALCLEVYYRYPRMHEDK